MAIPFLFPLCTDKSAPDPIPNITTAGLVKITVSIGVAVMGSGTANLAELMNSAMLAMDEAKRTGRNRIVVYPKETD